MIIVQDILEELGVTRAYKGYSHTEVCPGIGTRR